MSSYYVLGNRLRTFLSIISLDVETVTVLHFTGKEIDNSKKVPNFSTGPSLASGRTGVLLSYQVGSFHHMLWGFSYNRQRSRYLKMVVKILGWKVVSAKCKALLPSSSTS